MDDLGASGAGHLPVSVGTMVPGGGVPDADAAGMADVAATSEDDLARFRLDARSFLAFDTVTGGDEVAAVGSGAACATRSLAAQAGSGGPGPVGSLGKLANALSAERFARLAWRLGRLTGHSPWAA